MSITNAEYAALLARQAAKRTSADVPAPPAREKDLHAQITAECNSRGWIALHGSMAHHAYRIAGEWDFIIIAGAGRVLLVECKRPGGKLTSEQQALHHWARCLGHDPVVVHSFKEFLALLEP